MLTEEDRRGAAALLIKASASRSPIAPLRQLYPAMEIEDAYEIQRLLVEDRVSQGELIRGHKVGLTAPVMQETMGVDEPDYGHLLSGMFVYESSPVDTATLVAPRVEPEIAFVLRESLPSAGCNVADVLRCAAFVLPAIEIIDSRIADWDLALVDTVADSASSALVVLGGHPTVMGAEDLRASTATLFKNGIVAEVGSTGDVLGNPAAAVAWLANKLGTFGVVLEAGEVVLSGSCTKPVKIEAGDSFRAAFTGFGEVSISFA